MYTPKLDGKGYKKRARRALGFSLAFLKVGEQSELPQTLMNKHFGQKQNKLAQWLRDQLLIETDANYLYGDQGSKCKKYMLNMRGVEFVANSIDKHINMSNINGSTYNIALEWAEEEYQFTGEFEYEEKSNRYWHDLQNMRSDLRDDLLKKWGLFFKYDIQSAAPTILYQYSRNIELVVDARGKWVQGPNPLVLETLEYYLENKTEVRNKLATESETDPKTIKKIINALFAGAELKAHPMTAIWDMLDGDASKIMFLQQNPFIIGLRQDIKDLWEFIKPTMPFIQAVDSNKAPIFNKDGTRRKKKTTSRDKWTVYFEQEKRVIDEIRAYMKEIDSHVFLVHDGFYTSKQIDLNDLNLYIRLGLGYDLQFDTGKDWYALASQDQRFQKHSVSSSQGFSNPIPLGKEEFYDKYGEYPITSNI